MNKADNSKVTDKELQALLKILHSTYKAMPIGDADRRYLYYDSNNMGGLS